MGDFLSTPIKEKESEDNENVYVRYGSCGMQGWRKKMEDAHITDISVGDSGQFDVFAVFDGHGGKEVSQFAKAHFTQELLSNLNFKSGDIRTALVETFLKIDDLLQTPSGKEELIEYAKKSQKEEEEQEKLSKIKNKEQEKYNKLLGERGFDENVAQMTGCTSCVCVIDHKENKIYFANAGDSRVVLCKKGIAFPMSVDHKPDLDKEKNRIYSAQGWVTDGRIKGNLNLSRGLGDLEYKQNMNLKQEEQMITSYPDIVVENFDNNCDFIILGCDGIWDCLTNQQACNYVIEKLKSNVKLSEIIENMMDDICAEDIQENDGVGCDNMTCIVVQFKK